MSEVNNYLLAAEDERAQEMIDRGPRRGDTIEVKFPYREFTHDTVREDGTVQLSPLFRETWSSEVFQITSAFWGRIHACAGNRTIELDKDLCLKERGLRDQHWTAEWIPFNDEANKITEVHECGGISQVSPVY